VTLATVDYGSGSFTASAPQWSPVAMPREQGKVALIGADVFLRKAVSYRAVWVSGRYGSMKTLLSVAVSDALISAGLVDRCVGNVPFRDNVRWFDALSYRVAVADGHIKPLESRAMAFDTWYMRYIARFGSMSDEGYRVAQCYFRRGSDPGAMIYDAAVIFDEAWSVVGSATGTQRKALRALMAYLRKRNLVMLMPSVLPLHSSVSFFDVQRVWNLIPFGLPYAIFAWNVVQRRVREKGYFLLRCPLYFGSYDTFAEPAPGNDDALLDLMLDGGEVEGNEVETEQWTRAEDKLW